jgi:hypothetical protein
MSKGLLRFTFFRVFLSYIFSTCESSVYARCKILGGCTISEVVHPPKECAQLNGRQSCLLNGCPVQDIYLSSRCPKLQ